MSVTVSAAEPALEPRAADLARSLGLPFAAANQSNAWLERSRPRKGTTSGDVPSFLLFVTNLRLELRPLAKGANSAIYADFAGGKAGWRRARGGKGQHLSRALGLAGRKASAMPHVLDATAGLGQDAFVAACIGAHVTMCERHPVAAALLADGLERARICAADSGDEELTAIVERMTLMRCDAREVLTLHQEPQSAIRYPHPEIDVVYLDPMYPKRDTSALSKKEMMAFRGLIGTDDDAGKLLELALEVARQRVVVKRPRGAPELGGREPNFVIASPGTRYDVYSRL